ncbi:hypothetical protein FRC06_003509 [Ceratobasidium sp. 370]|nr:hypothetical protein FRC06_003509 [Ceratobasidium sp. 370]
MVHSGVGKLVKADGIAAKFRKDIEEDLAHPSARSRKPCLLGILSTSSAPSRSYAQFTKKTCEAIGIEFVLKEVGGALDGGIDGEGVEEAIIEANEDVNVDGIMVYYPIFGGPQDHYLQQVVSPFKDVEGLHVKFHYNLYHNIRFIRPQSLLGVPTPTQSPPTLPTQATEAPEGYVKSIIPCTPLAIVKALEAVGVYNAILDYGDRAASYKVRTEWLKDGCICVNVASERNFELDVREKASLYMPAVGKITQMMLLRNLLRLCHYRELLETTESGDDATLPSS